MDLFAERCAGIDIGKADLKACIRTPGPRGGRRSETRTFATTTAGVLALQGWLTDRQVRLVGMESTGVYWKPIFYPLEDHFECWLINPQHIKKVPGRKSDVSDAEWIARLVETGLVRASFVPPRQIRALRDLTRYRTSLLRERTREVQRLHSTLEDAGIKLAIVATDIMGKSGRDMITSLIAGQRDPHVLADLARRQMRTKIPALTEALDGRFTDHHALLCRMMLNRIDGVDATVAALDEQIAAATECFAETINRLIAIPGVARRTAEVIVAETGADMSRFPTAADLASWAGMCPGNNESAGKHFTGRTRQGNPWLRGVLGTAAAAASHTQGTYLRERYHRIAKRRGTKRALVAVGHSILQASWHIMHDQVDYVDLGADHYIRLGDPARRASRLVQQLRQLGYPVVLPDRAGA
jgi:transposase